MDNGYSRILRLRTLVGFLGETHNFKWWDTNFLSPTGRQFLAVIFPRTPLLAGFNATVTAAKRLHDDRIGKGGVYHLFRLPTNLEEDLHKMALSGETDHLSTHIGSKEDALDALAGMSASGGGSPEGPVQIGKTMDIGSEPMIGAIAYCYHHAFANGNMCFPYLQETA